uniref:Uncharacterized protein n=1 Tax=Kalanchoe fedtschenkoi TaxID=63787 RepID=A0A7N0THU5_KALFE
MHPVKKNMSQLVGLAQKTMLLSALLLLLASGHRCDETTGMVDVNRTSQPSDKLQRHDEAAVDTFLSSERRVPNASDPLHNR